MVSRTLQFFARREEFLTILQQIVEDRRLVVVAASEEEGLAQWRVRPFQGGVIDPCLSRLYLAKVGLSPDSIKDVNVAPGRLGLLQVTVPCECGLVLYMGQLAVQTTWADEKEKRILENPTLIKFYNSVASSLRKTLLFPVLARNIASGRESIYRKLGYTPSAKALLDEGGDWMQKGVKNVRFGVKSDMRH